MTKEQAIKFANCLKNNYTIDFNDMADFCDMAIKALEQQSSEDCVSRQAVLDNAYAYGNGLEPEGYCVNVEDIQALPPVTPTHRMCKDCTKSKILNGFEGYSIVCSRFGRMAVNPDFYCADYEKRGSENDI